MADVNRHYMHLDNYSHLKEPTRETSAALKIPEPSHYVATSPKVFRNPI